MRFVNYIATVNGDTINIPMEHPCKCKMALAEISMVEIISGNDEGNAIDIKCEQIDSSFDNPDRLLARIPFNRLRKNEYYHTWIAKYLQMNTLDSQDRFLTLKLRRTDNNDSILFGGTITDKRILLTLAFTDDDGKMCTSYT